MQRMLTIVIGALIMLAFATLVLVVAPYWELKPVAAPVGLNPYTLAELRARANSLGPDGLRGWGRAAVAGDYVYDYPHLLGTARTGPDLFNIGARQPSVDWHLGHLYQPRAYVPGSIMPSFSYLFEVKPKAEPGDRVVAVPRQFVPTGGVVVAKPAALDLAGYLLSL